MGYNIHYDVAALMIVITVMLHFFYKKTINTRQTRVFALLIWLAIISNIFDIITVYTIEHSTCVPIWLNHILNQIYLITFNATSAVCFLYIIVVTREKRKESIWLRLLMYGPIIIDIFFIVLSPITKWVYYFDENGVYRHGKLMVVLYVFAFFYVSASLVFSIVNRGILTIEQRVTVCFYTIASIVAVAFQMINSKIMIVQFAIAISELLIYLSLENPEGYSDKQLGIYNRRAFLTVLTNDIEKEKKFEILGIQIDGLKYINETLGVAIGNRIMKQIAEFLMQTVGKRNVFYLSGFQFAVLSDMKKTEWERIIGEIHGRFRCPFAEDNTGVSLSAQMCMLSYPENVKLLEDAIDMMEYLLEEAREMGEETVLYANDNVLKKGRRENQVLQIVKEAIRSGSFEVYYQPIYSVEKKRYVAAEALIRLKHEEIGFISPEEFIPMAERNGLILEIGEFVFREVCRFITKEKIWEKGIEYIDVNLSVVQCMQETLSETLLRIMDEYRLPYRYINLEITETAAVISSETLWKNMHRLMEQGVKFSLDDYGTGFSNTASIIEYPFHTIKLDKSMVWSAMENEKAMCALKHTISMIKDMRMGLVAEGVENEQQADKLAEMGCDFFQGYYYSKPVCEEDFLRKI